MSYTLTINRTATVAGISQSSVITRTGSGLASLSVSLAAAKTGTMSASAGVVDMDAGHGFTGSEVVDVYWADGLRHRCTVSNVNGNAVTLTGGSGDSLPGEGTELTVAQQEVFDIDFDGDDLIALEMSCAARARVGMIATTEQASIAIEAGGSFSWIDDAGVTNPIAGHVIDAIAATQGGMSGSATLRIAALYRGE